MAAIKILSINVHGLRDPRKCSKVATWLSGREEMIFFLQETYFAEPSDLRYLESLWRGKIFSSFGTNHSRGVLTLFKDSLPLNSHHTTSDNDGRWINVVAEINNSKLQLFNIYAPCPVGERATFFDLLPSHIRGGLPTIIGGDFNCIEDLYLDKLGGDTQPGKTALNSLRALTSSFSLVDIFRSMNPSAQVFTWTNSNVSSRLDKFLISPDILANSTHADITIFPFSDHDAPTLCFSQPNCPPRGRGVWKFNTSLLEYDEFTKKMKAFLLFWSSRKKDFAGKLDVWWDIGKKKIRGRCKTFSKKLAKEKKQRRRDLEDELQAISFSTNPEDKIKANLIRKEVELIDMNAINGARIRSKALEYQCDEKSSRYFFSLENSRQAKKAIKKLKTPAGKIIEEGHELLDFIAEFYQSLYSNECTDPLNESLLLNSIDKFVPDELKSLLDEPLSKDECLIALKDMKPDKSPGSDGLPAEFYTFFWDIIGEHLVEVFKFCYSRGLLTESMRLAILSLLYKKGDVELLKNWRPISLLNVDYKISSKAFALRLQQVLPFVLNKDQTCSVPGRSIFENLMLVRDSIDYCNEKSLPLALVKIDQEKAFDRVNWSFLEKVLVRMNFGRIFISFVKTMYNSVACKIQNNGHLSKNVLLQRGVRQGCPLSPLIYCLVAETLGNIIRNNKKIDGLSLPGSKMVVKISQYADDTTLFLRNNFSVDEALSCIKLYERGSGSKVNYDIGKSCGKWFNKPHYVSSSPSSSLQWTNGPFEVLGLLFGTDTAISDCWIKRVEKVTGRLQAWKHRSLSLKGKTLIINSIALSGIIFVGTVFNLPLPIEKQINQTVFRFLWSEKNELVQRNTMYLPIDQGGQGVTDIKRKVKALHLKFLQHIIDEQYQAPWALFARYNIGVQLIKHLPSAHFLRSNLVPHALKPSAHYSRLLSLCDLHKNNIASFSILGTSVKTIYNSLPSHIDASLNLVLKWNAITPLPCQWKIPWRNTLSGPSLGHENDLLWKIYHQVVKTAVYLKSWGLSISELCDICNTPEDISHIFLTCPVASKILKFLKPLLVDLTGTFSLDPSFMFFFNFPPNLHRNARLLAHYLLKLYFFCTWMHRCDRRFEKKAPDPTAVISKISPKLRTGSMLLFLRRR